MGIWPKPGKSKSISRIFQTHIRKAYQLLSGLERVISELHVSLYSIRLRMLSSKQERLERETETENST